MRSAIILAFSCVLCASVFAADESADKQWYKGVTHLHSLWSDGDMAPDMVAAWYKDHGYNFVCPSDHNVLLEGERYVSIVPDTKLSPERVDMIRERLGDDWVEVVEENGRPRMRLKTQAELAERFNEDGEFLMMPAEEITSLSGSPHVNAVNIRERILGGVGEVTELLNEYLDAVHEQSARTGVPMMAHVNHLNWSDGVTIEEMLAARRLKFFEVYNGHPYVRQWGSEKHGMPSNDRHWDVILSLRMAAEEDFILYALATDDSHEYYEWGTDKVNPGRGWVMVNADALDANSLIQAFHRGDFYASTGVTLDDVDRGEQAYTVEIAAAPETTYTTQFIGTRRGFDKESKPFKNEAGETPDKASRVYSDDIGVVLHETTENTAVYEYAGDELYVRAMVVSSERQENPANEGDHKMAWTQPVRVAQ
ncbi:MAG: histidinol-phosphatase [Candidatus Hydrogenedentota bacterium]